MAEEEVEDMMGGYSFQYIVEGVLMAIVSLFGLLGNILSIYVLQHKEVKLKKDFVEVLCSMSAYDNIFLICALVMFSLPKFSGTTSHNLPKIKEMTHLNILFPYERLQLSISRKV